MPPQFTVVPSYRLAIHGFPTSRSCWMRPPLHGNRHGINPEAPAPSWLETSLPGLAAWQQPPFPERVLWNSRPPCDLREWHLSPMTRAQKITDFRGNGKRSEAGTGTSMTFDVVDESGDEGGTAIKGKVVGTISGP